jgi:hypothetical protein
MATTLSLHWHDIPHGISFSAALPGGADDQTIRRHFKESGFKRGQADRSRWTAQGEEKAEDLFPWLLTQFEVENTGKPTDGTLEAHDKAEAAIARSRAADAEPVPMQEPDIPTADEFETGDLFKPS